MIKVKVVGKPYRIGAFVYVDLAMTEMGALSIVKIRGRIITNSVIECNEESSMNGSKKVTLKIPVDKLENGGLYIEVYSRQSVGRDMCYTNITGLEN